MVSDLLAELAERRRQLVSSVGEGSLIILASAPERLRNGDTYYTYRQDSHFYYLTGFCEPGAVALLRLTVEGIQFVLFTRPCDRVQAIWEGPRAGQLGACLEYGADLAYGIEEFPSLLVRYLAHCDRVYCLLSSDLIDQVHSAVQQIKPRLGRQASVPNQFINLEPYLHEMRLVKGSYEIECLSRAARISAKGHCRVMEACKPGLYEYQLEAELLHEFYSQGSRSPAYDSIVASGLNACILHYHANNARLQEGQLILVDAGCEYKGYAADITRTFPVNGRFTAEQKAIYQIVLTVQKQLIIAVKPGIQWSDLRVIAAMTLTRGLMELDLLKGSFEVLLEEQAYRRFCPHDVGHWLGLDVHDVGGHRSGQSDTLPVHGVLTIEPGIYITPSADVDEKWWNIGVRIEDDLQITPEGNSILSETVPKEIMAIEGLMQS